MSPPLYFQSDSIGQSLHFEIFQRRKLFKPVKVFFSNKPTCLSSKYSLWIKVLNSVITSNQLDKSLIATKVIFSAEPAEN